MSLLRALLVALVVGSMACAAGLGPTEDGGGAGGAAGGGGSDFGGGSGAESNEIAEVFGQGPHVLYRLDPITKEIAAVGNFSGCDVVIDIALDKDSNLIGTTLEGLYWIDKETAECTEIVLGDFPNSLSFIPAGTLDPDVEALVGFDGDQYVRIDPETGAIANVGEPWANGLTSSGDIVSVKDGPTFLTVQGEGCQSADCLVELDPVTGAMIKNWGPMLGYSEVYGIAFWAGRVYAFTETAKLFEVRFADGVLSTELISEGMTYFWGAGSTTSAPPIETPE